MASAFVRPMIKSIPKVMVEVVHQPPSPNSLISFNTINIELNRTLFNDPDDEWLKFNQSFHSYLSSWHHYLDLIEHGIDLHVAFKFILYFIYVIIFLIGIIGNLMVCYVVFRQPSMQTVTNLFISNLAMSDVLLCLFAVPFTPLYLLTYKEWIFGTALCRLVPFAQGVSLYISVLTLMSIAIERYKVIVHPFQKHFGDSSLLSSVMIIMIIWITAVILTLPYGVFIDVIPIPMPGPTIEQIRNQATFSNNKQAFNKTMIVLETTTTTSAATAEGIRRQISRMLIKKHYCDEMWPNDQLRIAFGLTTFVIQFAIPFCIITFCYVKVCLRVWSRVQTRPGSRSNTSTSSQRKWLEKERAKRTNKMLIFMVIIFVVSWLPLTTYNLMEDFYMPVSYWKHTRALFMTCHVIAMSSTCYNPFLYAWLNDNFRKEFKSIIKPLRVWFERKQRKFFRKKNLMKHQQTNNNNEQSNDGDDIEMNDKTTTMFPNTDLKDSTRTTRLENTNRDRGKRNNDLNNDDDDIECISMTALETTTNLVTTNIESINDGELQESLFVTSLHNGHYATRLLQQQLQKQANPNKPCS